MIGRRPTASPPSDPRSIQKTNGFRREARPMARHRAGCAMARGPPCGRSTVASQPPPSTLKTAPLSAARRPEAMRVFTPCHRAPPRR